VNAPDAAMGQLQQPTVQLYVNAHDTTMGQLQNPTVRECI